MLGQLRDRYRPNTPNHAPHNHRGVESAAVTIEEPAKIASLGDFVGIALPQPELRAELIKLIQRIEYRLRFTHYVAYKEVSIACIRC